MRIVKRKKSYRRRGRIVRSHRQRYIRKANEGHKCAICRNRHTFKDKDSWDAWRQKLSEAQTERYRKKKEAVKDILKDQNITILFDQK